MDTNQAVYVEDEEQDEQPKRRGRGCLPWAILLGIIVLGGLLTAPLIGQMVFRQETPLPGEELITDLGLRMLAVPAEYTDRKMPANANPTNGQSLFSAECAVCHGAEGRGDGPWGKALYPNAANLHSERTQTKTDGQLFWLVAHGINLTGMPAFGKDYPGGFHTDAEIWDLIAYIRTLKNN